MGPETTSPMVLRFGAFEIDLHDGRIRKSGVLLKLRPQAIRVLTLLAARSGEVVTREELRKEIWNDGSVVDFEQGLNFCIRQIRAVLGDRADSPRFIETIPRRGYRFLVPLISDTSAPAALPNLQPIPGRLPWRWRLSLILAAAALTGSVVTWILRPTRSSPVQRSVPLTSYPGSERDPALSPDSSQVAFTWDGEKQDNFDIYVKTIRAGDPLRLTSDLAEDLSPVWSPDGRTIAFLRRQGADRHDLLLIPARGGPERKLTEIGGEIRRPALHRAPRGDWLALSHTESTDVAPSLFLVSVKTGEKRRLTTAPRGSFGDHMPVFSPDGRDLAFVRLSGYSAGEIYRLPLSAQFSAAAEPQRLTTDGHFARSPAWTPDKRHILYVFSEGPGRKELRMIATSGPGSSEPVPLADDVSELSLGRHLTYSRAYADTNVWRAEIGSPGVAIPVPQRLIASTRHDGLARYSPDGKKIAFHSTRSGASEIWMAEADGSNAFQLTSFAGPQVGALAWSPDSRMLVFHARLEGQADVFSIPARGGAPKRLTTHPSDDLTPGYSHDGRSIYFSSSRTGTSHIWKIPAEGGEAMQVTHAQGGYMPMEAPGGKTLYFCHSLPEKGIWKMSAQGGEAVQVIGSYKPSHCSLAVTGEGLYYTPASTSPQQHSIEFLSLSTGKTRPVVLSDRRIGGLALSVSPDERHILFTQSDQPASDLMLIENFMVR